MAEKVSVSKARAIIVLASDENADQGSSSSVTTDTDGSNKRVKEESLDDQENKRVEEGDAPNVVHASLQPPTMVPTNELLVNWSAYRTENGVIYYHNALTGETTYLKPTGFLGEPIDVVADVATQNAQRLRENCQEKFTRMGSSSSVTTDTDGSNKRVKEESLDDQENKRVEEGDAPNVVHASLQPPTMVPTNELLVNWSAYRTENGVIYYHNALTSESTYLKPTGFLGASYYGAD